jgi:hypothetical protein
MAADNSFETITWWFFHYYNQINFLLNAGVWNSVQDRNLFGSLETELGKIQDSHGMQYVSNLRGMFDQMVGRYNAQRG